MRPSSDDERAAFLAPSATPGYCDDSLPTSLSVAHDDDDDAKPEPYTSTHRRRRWCGVRHLVTSVFSTGRRSKRRCIVAASKVVLATVLALLVLTPLVAPSYLHPPAHYTALARRCDAAAGTRPAAGCANAFQETVFISVSLYDKDGHLAGGRWGEALLELVHLLGADYVFVSIYENDSGRAGAAALESLRARLPCQHAVVYEEHVPLEQFPTVTMPDGTQRTKRLAYLSEMRNRALRPLDTLDGVGATTFDRVLFLNDVAFRPVDAAQLLFSTNADAAGRAQYLSACALDWKHPYLFYDVYAQRDAEGFSNGVPLFPVFSRAGQGVSRADALARTDAVRVQACWGGMVAMDAAYVQNTNATLPRPDFQAVGAHVIDPARPTAVVAPVRFRHEPELFYDACECCLFLADVAQAARAAGAAGASELGVYVNPYVRVAYDWTALGRIRWVQRWERLFAVPQAVATWYAGLPTHNPHRLVREGDAFVEEVWNSTVGAWQLEARTGRSGMFCGVRAMQLIANGPRQGDKNWQNAAIPGGQALDFPS